MFLYKHLQILWTFSIYLESVAILPQLFMVSKTGEAETITSHYLFALGSYRALYLLNWIYRYYFEGFFDLIAVVAGVVQTILYCDFFYLYITKGKHGVASEARLFSFCFSIRPVIQKNIIYVCANNCIHLMPQLHACSDEKKFCVSGNLTEPIFSS
jgi:hypothetical protein